MIHLRCPHCNETVLVSNDKAGEWDVCPACKKEFDVPVISSPAVPVYAARPAKSLPRTITESALGVIALLLIVVGLLALAGAGISLRTRTLRYTITLLMTGIGCWLSALPFFALRHILFYLRTMATAMRSTPPAGR